MRAWISVLVLVVVAAPARADKGPTAVFGDGKPRMLAYGRLFVDHGRRYLQLTAHESACGDDMTNQMPNVLVTFRDDKTTPDKYWWNENEGSFAVKSSAFTLAITGGHATGTLEGTLDKRTVKGSFDVIACEAATAPAGDAACSARLLKAQIIPGTITARDLRHGWILGRTGKAEDEKLPIAPDRKRLVEKLAESFTVLELYPADVHADIQPGDLLVYRLPWEEHGAVFVIQTWDRTKASGKVTRFLEKDATTTELEWSVSPDPPEAAKRLLRPGFFWLRPTARGLCAK